ncbi:unnamed protein product [Cylicocyclus nassatus]|uniref:vitamin-K-epoxide reductase (warfarin-sensitive) n=1 Tax=Cylicocyclus nassatus TaxID=53992 RepID=A0AA36GSU9_CYLNA|nr:unnamed protein product [Cylicocyclus nassatus]
MGKPPTLSSKEVTYASGALHTALAGLLISIYTLYVEFRAEADHEYTALCDISPSVSCTAALLSEYSVGFGIIAPLLGEESIFNQKNSLYGVVGYIFLAVIQLWESRALATVSLVLAVFLNTMSVYLGAALFKLRILCPVCCAIYLVNAVFLYYAYRRSVAATEIKVYKKKRR